MALFLLLVLLSAPLSAQVIFSANFDNTTGNNAFGTTTAQWRVNPAATDTATTGVWQRGNPSGTTYQRDLTPSGSFALVTGATNATDGDNDVDGGFTSVRSPRIALPATASQLTLNFQSYFSYSGGLGDLFRVTVRGTTNTTVLEVNSGPGSDINDYGLTTFDLLPFRGQTITILFEVADTGDASFVEAGIDDVTVTAVTPSIGGQVRFDSNGDGDLATTMSEDRPLAGVTLNLFADNGSGQPTGASLGTVVSGPNGNFRFVTPAVGQYIIVSGALAGTVSTADSEGANDDQIRVNFTGAQNGDNTFLDASTLPGLSAATAIYFLPYREADILTALDTLAAQAQDPVTTVNSISVAYPDTIILYDHWEDNGTEGYEAFTNAPAQRFTEVWGDGNIANGRAPGFPDDLLSPGDVIVLQNTFATTAAGTQAFFDGRDKISISRYVAVTKASWADSSNTLLAGAWELYPTILWGTAFTLPVGADMDDALDAQMFEYTGASVMAAQDDTQVRINGALVAVLSEGETFTRNGDLNLGDQITTSRIAQVQLITGDIGATFESRFYTIQPDTNQSNAYVAPTSTPDGSATLVFLHNNKPNPISINVELRDLPDQIVVVPANSTVSYEIPNLSVARLNSLGGETFFAIAAIDADNLPAGNQTHDWGYSLVPEAFLSPVAVAGFAPGDDPTTFGNAENSAPLWVAALFPRGSDNFILNHDSDPDNDVPITLCIDYNGDGNVDGLSTGGTDPVTGLGFDKQVTLDHIDQLIVYTDLNEDGIGDPGADQTGTRIWVCDGSDALIAMAYGQDPNTASTGSPAVDLGTTVPGIPVLEVAKGVSVENDLNSNTFPDVGDTLRYTIRVANSGTASFGVDVVQIVDGLNSFIEYVPNSTVLVASTGTANIADNTVGTPFPIDSDGRRYSFPPSLPPAETFFITFLANVITLPANGSGALQNNVSVTAGSTESSVRSTATVPIVTGTIEGTVTEDTDNDGLGEQALDNVELILLFGDGTPVDFDDEAPGVQPYTVTTLNGAYRFPNLPVGDYIVSQSQPAGFISVSDFDTTDGNDDDNDLSPTDNRIPVSIVADEVDDGNDFVERAQDVATQGAISGFVQVDTNNDDVADGILSGIEVTLRDATGADIDSNPGTPVIEPTVTVTGFDGSYSFSGLAPGNYQVVQTQPAGFLSVSDSDGVNDNVVGAENAIVVVAGATNGQNNFLEEPVGSLSGNVSADSDGDGLGDRPLAGIILTLKDAEGNDIDSDPNLANVQPTTTQTDSTGRYQFSGLAPGDYRVTETQPANFRSISDTDGGDLDEIGDQVPIIVVGGANTPENDFVEEEFGIVSGFVLADTDNDDNGEVGINNVTLTLQDAAGNDIDSNPATPAIEPTTSQTDSAGFYSFAGLLPGGYRVVQTQPSGFDSVRDTDGSNNNIIGDENVIVVSAGNEASNNNFIEEAPGSITGTVLADIDNNDSGDTPLQNITLTLKDSSGNEIDSNPATPEIEPTVTTTNESGVYSFGGLSPGNYQIVQTQPTGFASVSDVDGLNNNIIGDETPVFVSAGNVSSGNDFVEEEFGSLSGSVTADTDNNDLGDAAISGVILTLRDSEGDNIDSNPSVPGNQPTRTTTDGFGNYRFVGLLPGAYQVVETQPAGFNSVSDTDGANNDIIGNESPIIVVAGQENAGNNFVEEQPGSLSGTVLADINNDDLGDVAIENVLLTLTDLDGNNIDSNQVQAGIQRTTTVTNEFGEYSFLELPPGDYRVVQSQPSGFNSVSDTDGENNNIIGDENSIQVVANSDNGGNNFVEEAPGTLSGSVFADIDNDDDGDDALEFVVLTLRDASGNDIDSDPVADGVQPTTTQTNNLGLYTFANLSPGSYQVLETQPTGFASVGDSDGGDPDLIGDVTLIQVSANGDSTGNDFVEEAFGSLSGTVFADIDNDDVGDNGLEGVILTLKDLAGNDIDSDPIADGIQATTTQTNELGVYSFPNLLPGDYQIVQTQPSGFNSVSDSDGENNNTIGDETPVTVDAGQNASGNDFVEEEPGAISGTVLADIDNNDSGDAPIQFVLLTLKDSLGDAVDSDPDTDGIQATTTLTDENGAYTFANVAPGNYRVEQTQPSGFASVSDSDGENNNTIGDEAAIAVVAGSANTGNNFVEEEFGSISGFVRADIDNNDSGDVGLRFVELTLRDEFGNAVDSDLSTSEVEPTVVVTNAAGRYVFTGLLPGSYQVVETQPAGFQSVSDSDGSNNDIIGDENAIQVVAGAESGENNFVEEELGSISGSVLAFTALNNDGSASLGNVELTLRDSNGVDIDQNPDVDGIQPTVTFTDSNGNYSFPGLAPGDYQVVETQPAGFSSVSDSDGENNNIIGDENAIVVTAGANNGDNDFVEATFGSISGTVRAFTAANPTGDALLELVGLVLQDAAGNDIDSDNDLSNGIQPTVTVTDEFGNYSFENLPRGDYRVVQSQPDGFASISDIDGANNNVIGDEAALTVAAGVANTGNDFQEAAFGSLSGFVRADIDNDDDGDDPIADVLLTLRDGSGNDIDSDPVTDGVQPTTTETLSNGSYTFVNLAPGDYQVVQTQPSGFASVSDTDGENNNVIGDETAIRVTAGNETFGNNFVEEAPGSLSGSVLAFTSGSPLVAVPLNGVELTLQDAAGAAIDSDDDPDNGVQPTITLTDSNGLYQFSNLPPGDYRIVQTQPIGFASVSDTDGVDDNVIGEETPLTVSAGADTGNNDFVEAQFGSLSGNVLADTDNDDLGNTDAGIENVVLTLQDSAGEEIDSDPVADGVQPTTALTDGNGSYTFPNLAPGNYQVVQSQPVGFASVSDADGENNNVIGDETLIAVLAGADTGGNDFVEEAPGSIVGAVLAFTAASPDTAVGQAFVEVTLQTGDGNDIDSDGDPDNGTQPTVTLTDGSGNYSFGDLPPGAYRVVETQPAGFASVSDTDGLNNNLIGDESDLIVTANTVNGGNNFVNVELGSLSGSVLAFTAGNASGDAPLENVVLTLKDGAGNDIDSDPDTAEVEPTTAVTNELGLYTFGNLLPGNYQVVETQPAGFSSVSDTDGENDNVIGDEGALVVTAGTDSGDNDFIEAEFGSLSGSVLAFTALNTAGDAPLEFVELTLKDGLGNDIDSDGNPDNGVQPTTTLSDEFGNYAFENLPLGDYQVVQTQPGGFASVSDTDGLNDNVIGSETVLTVTPGVANTGNNFVEAEFGTLSGFVRTDIDNDDDGDDPIPLVVLTLKDSAGNDIDSDPVIDGVQPTTTETLPNGSYLFGDLAPGDYQVVQTQPSGFASVSDTDGANNNTIGDETPIAVTAGTETLGNNFVEEELGGIAGSVLADTNNDGLGNEGIANVVLTLQNADGSDIDSDPLADGIQPTVTMTASNGDYLFANVPVGSYRVVESQPAGFDSVSDTDGANNDIIGDETAIEVTAGATASDNNFVELAQSSKSDTFGDWTADFAPELGSETGLGDNPDGDIYPNALEYAFWLNPGDGLPGESEFCLTKEPDGTVTAEFQRRRGGLSDVTYTLEGADTLGTPTVWSELVSVTPTITTSGPDLSFDAEKVSYRNLQNASELSSRNNGVVRLRVEVDGDGNGSIEPGEIFFTQVFGWQCNDYNDYQCATFANPFKSKPVFSGTFATTGVLSLATDVDGNVTLDVGASSFGADLSRVVGSDGEFYLQMTSGPLEGERFDILNGGIDAITLITDPDIFDDGDVVSLNTSNDIPSDPMFNGASYQVIRYATVGDLFDESTIFAGEEDVNPSDTTRLLFFNSRRETPGFDILMLIGTNSGNSKWVFSNDLGAQNNQENLRLDPSRGNWIHPKSSGDAANPTFPAPVTQFTFGVVADYAQAVPINDGFNLLGAMWPLDQTPAGENGRDWTVGSNFEGGVEPSDATELLFWVGDDVADNPSVTSYSEGYDNYMLLDGGGMQNWIDINDFFLTNQDELLILESHRAVFLKLLSGDEKEPHIYPQPNF